MDDTRHTVHERVPKLMPLLLAPILTSFRLAEKKAQLVLLRPGAPKRQGRRSASEDRSPAGLPDNAPAAARKIVYTRGCRRCCSDRDACQPVKVQETCLGPAGRHTERVANLQ